MRKFTLLVFICTLLSTCLLAEDFSALKSQYFGEGPGRRRKYFIALHVANPLSAGWKVGGGLELRKNSTSYLGTYHMYYGGYTGRQFGLQMNHFFETYRPHQFFFYLKGVMSDSIKFVNTNLSLYGHTQDIEVGPQVYLGGGAGFGKRYNYNVIFWDWALGFKYVALSGDVNDGTEYRKAQQNMFRLFRFTGPGSILEMHFTIGIQI